MKKNQFKCDECGEVFKRKWTDEEAKDEAKELWGYWNEGMAQVCDDCFKKIVKKTSP